MKSIFSRLSLLALVLLAAGLPGRLHAQRERLPFEDVDVVEKRWPNAHKTATSLRYVIVEPGDKNGPTPQPGMFVSCLYKGMLLNGKVFDQATDPNHPLHMRLGRGNLIAGWEEALQKMHRGEKWIVIVPYELGYGTRGRAPDIPSRATLVFEMTLVDFGKE
ncbi:MAG TPA: FKBP-type peptidyl-prolyl cis-trans isomerase [Candidatus Didemnitutus sp.]|nr:FKBP-type peptidyl-prolyl cis-trans isomerase [Candidatus Didemnitutus sp.]